MKKPNEPESARESISRAVEEARGAPAEESGNASLPVDDSPMTLDRLHTLVSDIGTWVEAIAGVVQDLIKSQKEHKQELGSTADLLKKHIDLDIEYGQKRIAQYEKRMAELGQDEQQGGESKPRKSRPIDFYLPDSQKLLKRQNELHHTLAELMAHMTAPKETEIVRDPRTGRVTGIRQKTVAHLDHSGEFGRNGD